MDFAVINYENTKTNINRYGNNILSGITPVVCDATGCQIAPMWNFDIGYITQTGIYQHVDLHGKLPLTLKFDLKGNVSFDSAVIGGHCSTGTDFCIAEYELYASQSDASLFEPENRILYYCNDGVWKSKTELEKEGKPKDSSGGAIQAFEFSEEISARYFGLKILRGCEFDDIIRLARVQIHGKLYNKQRDFVNRYGNNLIGGALPYTTSHGKDYKGAIWPDSGLQEYLTDGIAADPQKTVKYTPKDGAARLVYKLTKSKADAVIVSGDLSKTDVSAFVSASELDLFDTSPLKGREVNVTDTSKALVFDISGCNEFNNLGLEFHIKDNYESFELDEIVCCSFTDTVRVYANEIINDDYKGNGVNLIPFATMPGNIAAGYNDAYWQDDYKRIITVKPAVARIWAQADWFEAQKGVYNFDTPEIKGLYKYLSAFKDSGTEVELTYSWKAGKKIQDWYSIKGVAEPYNSAPADLDDFAESCSVLMQRLWSDGFENVKYISFANEPGGTWDFLCLEDTKNYYCRLVRKAHERFVAYGIREKLEIWGPESADDDSWVKLCADELGDCMDVYTLHTYMTPSDKIYKRVKALKKAGAKRFMITEFGEPGNIENSFDMGYAGYVINGANAGFDGLLVWSLCGVKSMSVYSPNSWTMDDPMHLWEPQLNGGMPNYSYYIMGLLMRYIPSHSKVLRCYNTDKGVRAAVFLTPDGEYTIAAECSPTGNKRGLDIIFDKDVNKVFYKHVYSPGRNTVPDENAVLPETRAEFFCKRNFSDNDIEKDYCVVVYSTIKPPVQVKVIPPRAETSLEKCVRLSSEVFEGGNACEYSIISGNGTVSKDGVYVPDTDSKSGDMCAVKAESTETGAYGIALIRIV